MTEHQDFQIPTLTPDELLKLEELRLQQKEQDRLIEQAKLKQKEYESMIEQAKAKQEEAKLKQKEYESMIEQVKAKQEEAKLKQKEHEIAIEKARQEQARLRQKEYGAAIAIAKTEESKGRRVASKRFHNEDSSGDFKARKRLKTDDEDRSSTASDYTSTSGSLDANYYSTSIQPWLREFSIQSRLHAYNDNHIPYEMLNIFEDSFKSCMSLESPIEDDVQVAMDKFMATLFDEYKDETSLKYLNTSRYAYLNVGNAKHRNAPDYKYAPSAAKPACTFIFKNVNFNIEPDNVFQALQDFVICLGVLKAFKTDIDDPKCIVEICRYLDAVLDNQSREKMYGFITNLRHIRFYYVVRHEKNLSHYWQSEKLEIIDTESAPTSSTSNARTPVNEQILNEEKPQRRFNKDTIKIFINFLMMGPSFYEYNMLSLDPEENLFPDQYFIKLRSGYGFTSIAYKLIDKNNENKSRILKIRRHKSNCDIFLNELSVMKRLKELNVPNNYNLFFSNIEQASLEGNFILFEDVFIRMTSMELLQAQQLISINEYLYQCRIIHRDIYPQNIMIDQKGEHIKLIDFGFADVFGDDENAIELEIAGAVSCGSIKFLKHYSEIIAANDWDTTYEYERTFDLQCSLNTIMCMTNETISDEIKYCNSLPWREKIVAYCKFWLSLKKKNKNYNELLNLIENVSNLSDFHVIKDRIKLLF